MNRIPFGMLFIFSFLQASIPNDPFLEYQKYLSRMGACSEIPNRPFLLKAARNQAQCISWEDYKFLKRPSGFSASGAEWAHRVDVLGHNSGVLLLENSGINHADMQKIVEKNSLKIPIASHYGSVDHGSAMASFIHAIAPMAKIHVVPCNSLDMSLMDIHVINASFGGSQPEEFAEHFESIKASDDVLIVQSAGNDQENLSTDPYMQNCDRLLPFTIFAGNLGQDYKTRTSSGFPGKDSKIQKSFLWTVGSNILAARGPDGSTQYAPISGTSCSAALISGAASLFPSLTAAEKREVLLESADRDIFQEFGSGYQVIHIPDPTLTYYRQQSQMEKGFVPLDALPIEHVSIIPYDKCLWGMGILNIGNVLLYAMLKENFPEMNPSKLRECMLKLINRKQQVKASIIQKAFRKHQRSRKLPADDFEIVYAYKGMTINTSLEDRTFAEAPASQQYYQPANFIRKLTDEERLLMLGITLLKPPRRLRIVKTSYPFQITDSKWKACRAPNHVPEKLKAFIEASEHRVVQTFNTFFREELLPILRLGPSRATDRILENYQELLKPFSANRVLTLGKDWLEECGSTSYLSKIFHSTASIISLIHDGIRNKDLVEKYQLFAFSINLYEKIEQAGLMTDYTKSTILALLKYTKGEIDERFFSFVKENDLFLHYFNIFEVEENRETDMMELHGRTFRGIDLFNDKERKKFKILVIGEE